jgi:hypothetical protein
MDLVERYLNSVRFWLPQDQKQDIISELAEDIRQEIEEREKEAGRPLAEDDVAALLKKRGAPFSVAGKFLPPRHLIGPALYPIYIFVLKLATGFYLIPWLAVWLALAVFSPAYRAAHPGWELLGTLGTLWTSAFYSFGMITIGFAVGQRCQTQSSAQQKWDPRRLPAIRDVLKISRASSVADIVVNIIFLAWWMGGYRLPIILAADGEAWLTAPLALWRDFRLTFLMPIAILVLAAAALSAFNLIRPYWTRSRLALRAAIDGAFFAIAMAMIYRHAAGIMTAWNNVSGGLAGLDRTGRIQTWVFLSLAVTFGIAALGLLYSCLRGLFRIARFESLQAKAALLKGPISRS